MQIGMALLWTINLLRGYYTFFGDNLISWKSKKERVVARFSAKAEYKTMAYTNCKLILVRQILEELGFSNTCPMKLWCDNQASIHITSHSIFHE